MTSPPIPKKLMPNKRLLLYIFVLEKAVGVTLVQKDDGQQLL